MPKLSVLMPVKNGAAYLRTAVRSTLLALPRDAEIVAVDDASSDPTPEILGALAEQDPRLRVLRRERSTGVADALNFALARSDSAVVGRMDADDVCLPWRFRFQLPQLEDADFVFGSMVLVNAAGRPRGFSTPMPIRPAAAPLLLLLGNLFSHPTMCCRRQAVDALGGYASTEVEDYELWLRAVAAGFRLRKAIPPVLLYRMHGAQVTRTWRQRLGDTTLDAAYARLLPPELQDVAGVLRLSAVARRRESPEEIAAWSRLRPWIEQRAAALPRVDRSVVERRLASMPDATLS